MCCQDLKNKEFCKIKKLSPDKYNFEFQLSIPMLNTHN